MKDEIKRLNSMYIRLNSIYCLQPIGNDKYRVLNRYYSKFGSTVAHEKNDAEVVEIPDIENLISSNGWIHFYTDFMKTSADYEKYEQKVKSLGLEKYLV